MTKVEIERKSEAEQDQLAVPGGEMAMDRGVTLGSGSQATEYTEA